MSGWRQQDQHKVCQQAVCVKPPSLNTKEAGEVWRHDKAPLPNSVQLLLP